MSAPPSSSTADGDEIVHKFRFFRVHKDGRIVLNWPSPPSVPPSDAPVNGVRTRDVVVVSGEPRVAARLFLPENAAGKLPVLLFLHGGGFCMHSPSSPAYHSFVSAVASSAGALAVSVDYGLFPARPIPACYGDSWAAFEWVAAHSGGSGPDPWLNARADLGRVFVAGDSAGGNMTNDLVSRVGRVRLPGVRVSGAALIHPYFGGTVDDHMVMYMWPGNNGPGDPRVSPAAGDLAEIGCGRVLVFVAEKDSLAGPGKRYADELRKSGWPGSVEIVETPAEDHCFFLRNLKCEKAVELVDKLVAFIKQG